MEQTIQIYYQEGIWFFDDYEKDVIREPFVRGSSEIITALMHELGINKKKLALTFSDQPFQGYQDSLQHTGNQEEGSTWNQYRSDSLGMVGWLCPVLLQYFEDPPIVLYFTLSE